MSHVRALLAALAVASLAAPAGAQQLAGAATGRDSLARRARGAEGAVRAPSVASAVRARRAPVLDGREDDEAWAAARVVDGFREFDPVEDGEPGAGFRTVAKVAYDDRNLYVLVRAFDPRPDSILALLSRRDVRTASDWIKVVIDSYHDRRTGFEFMVNPAGVKRDASIINDGEEDMSWDAVWDAAARVDSAGWVAEFRIPFSQLRFADAPSHTFGFGVFRDIGRDSRRLSWPLYRRSQTGFPSQLGDLADLVGIPPARRLEAAPYVVQKSVTEPGDAGDASGFAHPMRTSVGADVKYGLTSNLTLDATVNPDFGQVEADPAVVNLTAFETRFQERRPFFLEGTGIFRFDLSCSDDVCDGLFYSRRVGRAPQLRGYSDHDFDFRAPSAPTATTILGAAKLTGRTRRGTSIGVLDAVTQREEGARGLTIEPATNYAVGRLQQDFRKGASGLGAMVAAVHRDLRPENVPYLRREAYTGGADFRHRFGADNRWQLSGYLTGSVVRGDTAAMRRTQESGVHNYQRPDSRLDFDPSRTSLAGAGAQLSVQKLSGLTRLFTGYTRFSPGFEINDAGFSPRADQQGYSTWYAFVLNKPRRFYRRAQINFNQWNQWNVADGLATGRGGNINAHGQLTNQWWLHMGLGPDNVGAVYNDRDAHGGPAFRRNQFLQAWFGVEGDQRKRLIPYVFTFFGRGDHGRTRFHDLSPSIDVRASSRFTMSLSPSVTSNVDDSQFYTTVTTYTPVTDGGGVVVDSIATDHYVFGRLNQRRINVRTRVDYTMTTALTFQLYAEPFASAGQFRNLRELGEPRASDYDRRFVPFAESRLPGGAIDNSNVNVRQFHSNAVVRWEYRPGSTIFVVWSQGRGDSGQFPGSFDTRRDYDRLFRAHPDNTFLIKASYWFGL
ncbi:MAG TPA: DUF5916 domain-containing protein [Gemmatimonadaceae bacterium]|nr:DUF5916 domain-containing protein [Gemmatimonadaceae bacterium]